METKVFSIEGEEIKNIDLNDEVFNVEINDSAIYYAIQGELANRRIGTAATKNRKLVRGSNSKPWRQKGTGHARAGDKKSPVWVGGGTIFGPQPRDYHVRTPRKLKRAAVRSILSRKAQSEGLKVVEDFTIESGKTRDLVKILKNLIEDERTLIVLHGDDQMIRRAGRNIPWLTMQAYNRLSAHELLYSKNVIVMESAVGKMNEFFTKAVERGRS